MSGNGGFGLGRLRARVEPERLAGCRRALSGCWHCGRRGSRPARDGRSGRVHRCCGSSSPPTMSTIRRRLCRRQVAARQRVSVSWRMVARAPSFSVGFRRMRPARSDRRAAQTGWRRRRAAGCAGDQDAHPGRGRPASRVWVMVNQVSGRAAASAGPIGGGRQAAGGTATYSRSRRRYRGRLCRRPPVTGSLRSARTSRPSRGRPGWRIVAAALGRSSALIPAATTGPAGAGCGWDGRQCRVSGPPER